MPSTLNPRLSASSEAPEAFETLYLIDASIYVFEAWKFAPRAPNSPEQPAHHTLHGFIYFVTQLLSRCTPAHIVFAFDQRGPQSIRQCIEPSYKANRPPVPDALKQQFALCREWLSLQGFAQLSDPYIEADDIIGLLAGQAQKRQQASIIVSADKDLTQFVGKHDQWWDYNRNQRLDYRGVQKRFRVRPEQIPDLLALSGDTVDNIAGVPGVGLATAARLLIKWGSLDNLFAHTAQVAEMRFRGAPRIAELLEQHQHTVRQSRKLTGLIESVELPPVYTQRQAAQAVALQAFEAEHRVSTLPQTA